MGECFRGAEMHFYESEGQVKKTLYYMESSVTKDSHPTCISLSVMLCQQMINSIDYGAWRRARVRVCV